MLYRFAKILMTVGLRFFYRHIHVSGIENIPANGPVIIIANHASSLMDAALLGILLDRPAWFFTRGDVFVNRYIRLLFSWLHMMPVHNHEKGRKTIGANNDSFLNGQQVLSKGGIVVFFPESTSHVERQLWPFRKGVFRLAFKTATDNDYSFDVPIVPVGITYEHPVHCRTNVQVHIAKPILLSDYKAMHQKNAAATLLCISKDANQATHKKVLHVEDNLRLQTAEHVLIINRNNTLLDRYKWKIRTSGMLETEQGICNKINTLNSTEFAQLQQQSHLYFDELKKFQLDDKTIQRSYFTSAGMNVLLWLGFPVYLVGLILNGLPIFIARKIADKKVYRQDFYSWIFVTCYSFLYFLWLIGLVLIIGFSINWLFSFVMLLVILITGLFAYAYKGWMKEDLQETRFRKFSIEHAGNLRKQREKLQALSLV